MGNCCGGGYVAKLVTEGNTELVITRLEPIPMSEAFETDGCPFPDVNEVFFKNSSEHLHNDVGF